MTKPLDATNSFDPPVGIELPAPSLSRNAARLARTTLALGRELAPPIGRKMLRREQPNAALPRAGGIPAHCAHDSAVAEPRTWR